MANYWPGIGYITPRRTTTISSTRRRPSIIPSTSTPTPPSSTSWKPRAYILGRAIIPPATPQPSSSTLRGKGKSTCACSPTNHPGSYRCALHRNNINNGNKKKLNTTSKNKKEAQGGHFPTSDRLDLPRKVLLKSLLQMGPEDAHLARQHSSSSSPHPRHHTTGGAALQPRPSRLSIMAVAHDSH